MTHLIGPRAPVPRPTPVVVGPPRCPALPVGLATGAAAALAGLALTAVPLFLLWIVTPYVQLGAVGAFRLSAALWLLAHGAELLRTTGTGPQAATAPVGIAPLLITAAVLGLLYRAGAYTGRALSTPAGEQPAARPRARTVATALLALCGGYLGVAAAAVLLAAGAGLLRARPLPALAATAAVALAGAAAGLWSATRPWRDPSGRSAARSLPGWAFPAGGAAPVLRAAVAGCAALLGAGALLLGTALLIHGGAAGHTARSLAPDLPGLTGLLLLCLALYPDAVVWATAYALGPGFTLGTGSTVAPHGTVLGETPRLPLLAALPGPAPAGPLGWAALALPPLAGVALAAVLGRAAAGGRPDDPDDPNDPNHPTDPAAPHHDPQPWHPVATATAALAAALATGLALAACAAASGGALGTGRLAALGPVPWQVGAAAAGWTAAVGLPGALLVRHLLRRPPAARSRPADPRA
ncbi:DUF6350 family protein [Streptomyces sp. NPDC092296]|uniref:cell division protein PerM n=1 Tax=Streptomyces sp. NPDC092296 TaxID=3366012 RepID=UPI0038213303